MGPAAPAQLQLAIILTFQLLEQASRQDFMLVLSSSVHRPS